MQLLSDLPETPRLDVRGRKLRDYVYDVIRGELRQGGLAPGERLVEHAVAQKLGVSRTPVREALFQLAQDGLLVTSERGYMAPELSPRDIREIYEMRLLLEPQIVRYAAELANHDQVIALLKALESEQAAQDGAPEAFIEANLEFRRILLAICPNTRLAQNAALYEDQVRAVMALTLQRRENRAITVDSHRQVFAAIKDKRAERAANAARELLYRALDYYLGVSAKAELNSVA